MVRLTGKMPLLDTQPVDLTQDSVSSPTSPSCPHHPCLWESVLLSRCCRLFCTPRSLHTNT